MRLSEVARVAGRRPRDSQLSDPGKTPVDRSRWGDGAARDGNAALACPRDRATEHHEFFHKPVPVAMIALILASGSSIRRTLLEAVGLEFSVERPGVDEDALKAGFDGGSEQLATLLAEAKALAVAARVPDAFVIGSDSIAECDGTRFDKPRDREEAATHLRFFSGKPMAIVSAVVLARGEMVEWRHAERTLLSVRPLSETFIAAYLDAEWPAVGHCAGVFRMEGRGATLFQAVEGSHFTVLGLPLLPLLGALRERGVMA